MKRQLSDAVLATVRNKEVDVIWAKLYRFELNSQFFCLFSEESATEFSDISVEEHRSTVFGGELKVVITATNAVLVMFEFHGETSKNF